MADSDIPSHEPSIKQPVSLAPTPFDVWASSCGYDITPAVSPIPTRIYAERRTQEVYDAYIAGCRDTARMVVESTLETPALREKLLALAGAV